MDIDKAKLLLINKTKDIVIITKAEHLDSPLGPEIVWVNQAFSDVTRYTLEEVIGKTPRILQGQDTDKETLQKIKNAILKEQDITVDLLNYTKNNTPYWVSFSIVYLRDDSGKICFLGAIERDITAIKMMTSELIEKTITDPLTQVNNRDNFFISGDNALKALDEVVGLLFFDVDDFKRINDVEGHLRGDEILKTVAQESKRIIRRTDKVFRYGGDEFAILFFGVTLQTLENKANQLLNNLARHNISISIGGTISNKEDKKISDLVLRADKLLYQIKKTTKKDYLVR